MRSPIEGKQASDVTCVQSVAGSMHRDLMADLGVSPWPPKFSKSGNPSHSRQHINMDYKRSLTAMHLAGLPLVQLMQSVTTRVVVSGDSQHDGAGTNAAYDKQACCSASKQPSRLVSVVPDACHCGCSCYVKDWQHWQQKAYLRITGIA